MWGFKQLYIVHLISLSVESLMLPTTITLHPNFLRWLEVQHKVQAPNAIGVFGLKITRIWKKKKKNLEPCGAPNLCTLLFRTVDLGSQFIYWWASLQSYRFCFKHSLDRPTSRIPVVSSSTPSSLLMMLLTFFALFVLSSPVCLPLFLSPLSLSLSASLSTLPSLLFSLSQNNPFSLSTLIPLYRLPLVGLKSLLFTRSHVFPLSPIIPRKSCPLKILSKLVPAAKLRSAANSPRALLVLEADMNLSISSLISHCLIGQ